MFRFFTVLLFFIVYSDLATLTAQNLGGYWSGVLSGYRLPKHNLIQITDSTLYLIDIDIVVDSLKMLADDLILNDSNRTIGKVRLLDSSRIQVHLFHRGRCDILYETKPTKLTLDDSKQKIITSYIQNGFVVITENEGFYMVQDTSQIKNKSSYEIVAVSIFDFQNTLFLKIIEENPKKYNVAPIVEFTESHFIVFDWEIDENIKIKLSQ